MKIMLELRLFFAKILASFQTDSLSKNSVPENQRSKTADTACQKSASATFFSPETYAAAKLCTWLCASSLSAVSDADWPMLSIKRRFQASSPLPTQSGTTRYFVSLLIPESHAALQHKSKRAAALCQLLPKVFRQPENRHSKTSVRKAAPFRPSKQPASSWEAGCRFQFSLGRRAKPVSGKAMATIGRK